MAQTVSYIKIAESLQKVAQKRFHTDIFRIVLNEGMVPTRDHKDLHFELVIIAVCRLAAIYGCTSSPTDRPPKESPPSSVPSKSKEQPPQPKHSLPEASLPD